MYLSINELIINQTSQSIWQNIKLLIDVITSLCIFIGAIFAYLTFKYKFDSSIRDLYIENSKSVYSILENIIEQQEINIKQVDKMQELELYSKIYLHSDISHFINIIHGQLTTMWGITLKIESIGSCEDINSKVNVEKLKEKSEYEQQKQQSKEELIKYKNNLPDIYRKHIISEVNVLKWLNFKKMNFY